MQNEIQKIISFVVPVYNEEKNIPLLVDALARVMQKTPYGHEIIFVNDGSVDKSIFAIAKLAQENSRIRGLDFSRNFGKEVATSAGCYEAAGDAVITMDADLQHPPEKILELLEKWEKGAEVVYTVRKENRGAGWFKKTTSKLYYWIFNKMTSVTSEPHSTDFRLMDRKVIDAFKHFPERERIFRGIIDWMGFRRDRVEFVAPDRRHGYVAYSYKKLFHLAINSLTAFSLLPLRIAGYFGIVITLVSGLLLLFMLIMRWFFDPEMFTPIAILATGNTLLIGIVLISLGLIALYIARIHDEVINRPMYIVREKINFPNLRRGSENKEERRTE